VSKGKSQSLKREEVTLSRDAVEKEEEERTVSPGASGGTSSGRVVSVGRLHDILCFSGRKCAERRRERRRKVLKMDDPGARDRRRLLAALTSRTCGYPQQYFSYERVEVLMQRGHGVRTDRSRARHRRLFAQLPDNVWILAAAQSARARLSSI
jgi:hypothetical protein